ncbi:MAG TPA: hypothetical protein VHB25_03095 [Gemmatimonadaceae bacterium]|nr:hypothetical protein [Gemmatimonadaceae bacterium]
MNLIRQWQGRRMSDQHVARELSNRVGTDGRRRQLRTLLLTAADAARQGRRLHAIANRAGRDMGRAVRDRVSMLLSAAG